MSAFSDWHCGAMSDDDFEAWGTRYNAQERYYEAHADEPTDSSEDVDFDDDML